MNIFTINSLKKCFLIMVSFIFLSEINAQTSVQNFGTTSGSHTSQTGSTTFIPAPTSGTTWARAGAVAPNAPINLVTTANPVNGTGAYLQAAASSTSSVGKVSPWVGYTPSTEFYTSFNVLFGDAAGGNTATNGTWSFYQGAGAMYSDANDFAGAQVFTGLRFTFAAAGAVNLTFRNGAAFNNTGLGITSLAQNTLYHFEILGNNSAATINYNYAGNAGTIAPQKFDLYLDGVQIGNDLSEALLPAGTNITSGTFIGVGSTLPAANTANIFLDDVVTYNSIASAPIPVTFKNISAAQKNGGIQVDWNVANEFGIKNYEVQRSLNGMNFSKQTTITAGVNSGSYSWFDNTPNNGVNFYRVSAVDFDGKVSYTNIVKVVTGSNKSSMVISPNPATGKLVNLQMNNIAKGEYNVSVITVSGQVVYSSKLNLNAGSTTQSIQLPGAVTPGIYQLKVIGPDQQINTQRLVIAN